MQQLQRQGYERDTVLESLLAGDCNAATAAYHLLQQALTRKQQAVYSHMQLQQSQQTGYHPDNAQQDSGNCGKRMDTPMRLVPGSHSAHSGIQAYRPTHAALEVEGVAAGYGKEHKQQPAQVSDDSAQALHQSAALRVRTGC